MTTEPNFIQHPREQIMSYVDRIAEKIQPDALLHQLGLQRARETSMLSDTVLPALAIFGAGLLVGAGIALMATPKSGRELRDDLSRRAGELGERVRARMPHSDDEESSVRSST
jgi:gas vesicle protein